jgi:bifunctional UDP-N-acetylglucosamine pyrophosphorylase/glucosamine-1-phosphate N-acetyltransferase
MKSPLAKVLHPVGGRPILGAILDAVDALNPALRIVVTGAGQSPVGDYARARDAAVAIQDPPRGTGHAAQCALPALDGFDGDVLILYGDTPLLTAQTLRALVASKGQSALALLGFTPADPGPYGRLILDETGALTAIVEARDATPDQLRVGLCNAGGFVLDAALLRELLGELTSDNAQGEFYITDIVKGANRRGLRAVAYDAPADDVMGVNSQSELAAAEAVFQDRARRAHMANGVSMPDPSTVYVSADTVIGPGTTIGQNVVIAPGVAIAPGVTIKPFCHLEGVTIATGAIIGPFARLRPGSEIGEDVHIGNFVETKATIMGKGAKANHLTYLGDATVGAGANIGAGTITCNYDGFFKYRTEIGAGAFIGSNASLVAPVTIGENANTAAGSVITRDVAADALAIERSPQVEKPGWAQKFRTIMRARKSKKD